MAFKANTLHQVFKAVSREQSRQPRNESQEHSGEREGADKETKRLPREVREKAKKKKKKCFHRRQVRKNFKESVISRVKGI